MLIYTVDATLPTGSSPLVILPKVTSMSPDYGYLYQAPYQLGDTATHTVAGTTLTVKVLRKFGASYYVEASYHRR